MSRTRTIAGVVSTGALAACSLLTSLDGLSGGGADGGTTKAGTADGAEPYVPPPTTCASPATECIDRPPAGWTGPFAIYDGTPASAPSACPSPELQVLAVTGAGAAPGAQCAPCACALGGVACPMTATVQTYSDPSCKQTSGCSTFDVALNICEVRPPASCPGSVKVTTANAIASCSVDGGQAVLPAPTLTREVLGCKAPSSFLQQVDCSGNRICAPKPAAPFELKLCVLQAGDVACPPPPYIDRRLVDTAVNDTRGCTACSCQVPATPCTGGIVYTGPSGTCNPSNANTPFAGCFSGSDFEGPDWLISATPPAIACAVDGGQPTGGLVPTTAITVCCN